MFIKLQPEQVSFFWGMIKHGAIVANKIPDEHSQDYTIDLLYKILSGLSQCWLGVADVDGKRTVRYMIITKIIENRFTDFKILYIDALYSYNMEFDWAREAFKKLSEFGRANECQLMFAETAYKQVETIIESTGVKKCASLYKAFL